MKVLISAGEYSGDLYAARMVRALRESWGNGVEWLGMGGPALRDAGVETAVDTRDLQAHGLIEVVPKFGRLYRAFVRLVRLARERQPDWALLVDFPDFHLRLGKTLRAMGIPVVQFIAPTVWAWRSGRVRTLRQAVDKLLVVFPFEEPLFRGAGLDAEFIGHPLLDTVRVQLDRAEFLKRMGWSEPVRVIGLLPGSRPQEVRRLLPVMLRSLPRIGERLGPIHVFLVPAPTLAPELWQSILAEHEATSIPAVEPDLKYEAMANADLLLVASGTATLEGALTRTPMIVLYRLHPLTWWVARRLVRVPYASIVNIIARRSVVPELLQKDVTPENIAHHAERILQEEELRRLFTDYLEVIDELGCLHAFEEGPRVLEAFLNEKGIGTPK